MGEIENAHFKVNPNHTRMRFQINKESPTGFHKLSSGDHLQELKPLLELVSRNQIQIQEQP
ncbi:unnamed protein product [Brassica oleracea var. botrytis]